MNHCLLTLLAVSLIPGTLMGRTAVLQFVILPGGGDTGPIELLTGKGESITIEASSQEVSKPYRVDRRGQWTVGKFESAANGIRKFTEYGSAKSLATRHQLVILIRMGSTHADGFKVIVAGNGLVQFGGGAYLLVNGSDKDIGARLGAEELTIAPGEHGIVKPEAAAGRGTCHVQFSYRKMDKMKPFLSTNWPVNANTRGLICFHTDPETKRLGIHSIRDFVK